MFVISTGPNIFLFYPGCGYLVFLLDLTVFRVFSFINLEACQYFFSVKCLLPYVFSLSSSFLFIEFGFLKSQHMLSKTMHLFLSKMSTISQKLGCVCISSHLSLLFNFQLYFFFESWTILNLFFDFQISANFLGDFHY